MSYVYWKAVKKLWKCVGICMFVSLCMCVHVQICKEEETNKKKIVIDNAVLIYLIFL